jgi:hypothetical protein
LQDIKERVLHKELDTPPALGETPCFLCLITNDQGDCLMEERVDEWVTKRDIRGHPWEGVRGEPC